MPHESWRDAVAQMGLADPGLAREQDDLCLGLGSRLQGSEQARELMERIRFWLPRSKLRYSDRALLEA